MNFWDLIVDLESDLSETSMVSLVIEWFVGLCDFDRILRRGPGARLLS